ncbi:MAG TPA: EAL domain-containing protein, partial [Caulobacteraceae bacterium]|nr:EAL domain-containing protein [Caulobacteraceae bacterium]
MRKLTMALLGGASICLAVTIALLLWRVGGGWVGAAAGLAAGLGLAFSLQGVVGRSIDNKTLRSDFDALKQAHLEVTGQLEQINESLAILADAVQEKAVRRSEELTFEVRMLEDLIQRMSQSLDERLAAGLAVEAAEAERPQIFRRPPAQTGALLNTVREALAENRVDLYLQPVVTLPQRRTVFYESFSRLRDATGQVMMPAQYLSVAEPEGLVAAIDNLLLFRCVQIVRRLAKQDRKVAIFCNISLSSLGDETFFPQFLEFLSENRDMAGGLIFELGLAAFEQRGSVEARNMAKLADVGFRFSIDKVTDVDAIDFRELQRADVKFIKIAAETMLEQIQDARARDIHPSDFASLARRYGAEIIAEKIEAERQVIDVLELDIGYGQG